MPATTARLAPPRRRQHPRAAAPPRARGRLTLPDLELLLDAVGDREDRATRDERARLHRIRRELERDLADLLAE